MLSSLMNPNAMVNVYILGALVLIVLLLLIIAAKKSNH